ncbi:MAG: hypothetical protein NTX33_03135 [Propionibacteriales bacterium]|nr:hypothetical protein [Propionibacteriales bacterium]
MNRLTIVSLTAAAVLGSAGGVTLAVASSDNDTTGRDDPTTSARDETTKPTDGPDDAGLFYYADGAIHDGDQDVAVPTDVGDVLALQRVKGGWLLIESSEYTSGDPTKVGTFIATNGDDWRIGEWRGTWDLTVERDRVVYGNGVSWKAADFATRRATPLDVIDGSGEELDFMTRPEIVSGIAITGKGVLTGWLVNGENLIVQTETDHWSHELLVLPRSIDVPLTSADGTFAIGNYENPDYTPTNPVGSCLTGGRMDAVDLWWKHCGTGPASEAPYSRDGEQLLVRRTSPDGPAPSALEVIDPTTGNVLHEFDPGGYLEGVQWGEDADTVVTLSGTDDSSALTISRCATTTGKCVSLLKVQGNVVLGSST